MKRIRPRLEYQDLQAVVDKMLELKRRGEPVLNSELTISLLVRNFREESARPEAMPCRFGMRDFFISTNSHIEVCYFYSPIGNIKAHSAREISYGPSPRHPTTDCRVRQALSLHMSFPEDHKRQGQNGPDYTQPAKQAETARTASRIDRAGRISYASEL